MKQKSYVRVKERRLELKWSLEKLAVELQGQGWNISKSTISSIERGLRRLNPEDLVPLARALRVDPNWLVGWDE